MNNLYNSPHRRYNILTGDWIKVSPHRTKRPWQGKQESSGSNDRVSYDPECYLCPGNSRAGGKQNPNYSSTYSFVNDFSALLPENDNTEIQDGLFSAKPERGICKVICFSPRHDLTLPRMDQNQVETVVRLWKEQYQELAGNSWIRHIQIFENHGSTMGCSNPHPHGQIWADNQLPDIPAKEDILQKQHEKQKGTPLLSDYLEAELQQKERIVLENDFFAVLVPYWAVWPYETMILPKQHAKSIADFNDKQIAGLADVIRRLGIRYDNLFQTDFPYSMGIHQAPVNNGNTDYWTFHMHYYPPLLRSATIKKFMVGYEMLAMAQRDITAETSAEILRGLSETHYSDKT